MYSIKVEIAKQHDRSCILIVKELISSISEMTMLLCYLCQMKISKQGKGAHSCEEAEYNEEMSDVDNTMPEVDFTPPRSRGSSWSESGGPSSSRSSLELKRQSPSPDCRCPAKKPRPGLDRTIPSHVSENDSKFQSCGVAVFKL
jgi:hypothetical protein